MSTETQVLTQDRSEGFLHRAVMLFVVVVPFLLTIFAIWRLWRVAVYWPDLVLFAGMYLICGLGITIGYHRMLTHNGFQAPTWLRSLFLAAAGMAVERGPVTWASTHLKHHAHSDKEGDPHSPLDGFFHAHLGWMLDGWDVEPDKHGPWLLKDELVLFFERTFGLWVAVGLVIPLVLGGLWSSYSGAGFWSGALTGLLWGGAVRIFMTHHVTWSVNSICHTFGKRPFATRDLSRNNFVVGVFALGEGWHNNHHAFPNSVDHGLEWWQIDLSAYIIRGLEKVGLIWDVRRVTPEQLARRLEN